MTDRPAPDTCNCQAVRKAARHVTQFYDRVLSSMGLRTSQFSILVRLHRTGPRSIQSLAAELAMDRTTLGRNLRPLERDGLLSMAPDPADRRSRALVITELGRARMQQAGPHWADAQARFEAAFGPDRAQSLRHLMADVVSTPLDPISPDAPPLNAPPFNATK